MIAIIIMIMFIIIVIVKKIINSPFQLGKSGASYLFLLGWLKLNLKH